MLIRHRANSLLPPTVMGVPVELLFASGCSVFHDKFPCICCTDRSSVFVDDTGRNNSTSGQAVPRAARTQAQ